MTNAIFEGLSLVDSTGRVILATTIISLLAGIGSHAFLAVQYRNLERDLEEKAQGRPHFAHPVLNRIVQDATDLARHSAASNTQAIIENNFQIGLKPLLLAERFVRAATGLVLVLGLLGTFYGLTLSIGTLVHLVSADSGPTMDVAQALTQGLTHALAGMAAAFSNSLAGIVSAVILTVLGVLLSVTDRRTALMVQVETYLDRLPSVSVAARRDEDGSIAAFATSVDRLDGAVTRFESALQSFAVSTKNLREVQLVVALRPGDGR